ncbi:MAG TPA: outer membrane lipoprotein-sorting protein [Alphaproteobacteria bacterium]|nr:outer membrane lipoprotein-sorting protein [Alphaproteobacteria bacterium]
MKAICRQPAAFLSAFAIAAAIALAAPPALAEESAEEKGLRIAQEAEARDRGFGNYSADQTMILRNKRGQESERNLRISVLENEADGDKSLIVFNRPRDVKGTAMLTHSHKVEDDDQWLYLPALKRVKRISSSNKAGSFMGSEFAYEDMTSQEIEKYTYRWLRDEPCGELTCWVSERAPVGKNSGYTRQVSWVDQDEYRIWKVEYYDRKKMHLKTLTVPSHQQYLGKHWRADEMMMVNHLTGKSARLIWKNYRFGDDLDDSDFTKVSLKRAR